MTDIRQIMRERLMAKQDAGYQAFIAKLIPTLDPERVIGVRAPALRTIVKAVTEAERAAYLALLPHHYYEEHILHAALIGQLRDYDEMMARLEAFLPYVDNWAVCDSLPPKLLTKRPEESWRHIQAWIADGRPYHIRFGVVCLMGRFLDKHFQKEMLPLVAGIRSEEYYVNMALAWYLCEALIKQPALAQPLFEQGALPKWVHNKAIQKAVESRQVSEERKSALRALRRR